MAYFAPYIDASGMHIPTYPDIRDSVIEEAKAIFGEDTYLEIDSADYQLISVISLKMYDCLQAAQLAFNNRSPATAVGIGLDSIVLVNGLARIPATYSTCQITLTGTSGTVITGGIVKDTADYLWDLPETVTIPPAGTITVTAVCQTIGPIEAEIGQIIYINTPTAGWVSVTNSVQAIAGKPQETDAALRARQAISVAIPSQTLLEGTLAGIRSVAGVTRSALYENDTNSTSIEGFPAHSITAVVEGGTDADIAQEIYLRKGIGAYTNGTTSTIIADSNDMPTTIRFYRPSYVDIYVDITIKRLSGWLPALETSISDALVDYLTTLELGEDIIISSLWGVVMSQMPDIRNPVFSITSLEAGLTSGSVGTTDITIDFDEASQSAAAKIAITLV